VTTYAVARRTHEIGIRVAMGAHGREIARIVLGEIAAVTAIGIAVGCAGSLGAGRLLGNMLFQVKADDPLVLAASCAIMAAAAVAAAVAPMRRAVTLDPMRALRYE
jgi:putative ABC transport system permease protein